MGYAETQAGFDWLRRLFIWAYDNWDVADGRHTVRGELQGTCRDGRFVLSTQHVDGHDRVAGLLECEAATLPPNLELRDHLDVEIEVLERAKTIDSKRLSRLIDERLFHSIQPGYPWLRARVLRIRDVDRSYRVTTPAICRAILPLGLEDHGMFWDWRRIEDATWGSRRVLGLAEDLTLFAAFEGTRAIAKVCGLNLFACQRDWRPGVPRLLEAIQLIGRAAGLGPLEEPCVRAIHEGATAIAHRYAVLQTVSGPEVRIRLAGDDAGSMRSDAIHHLGPWARAAPPTEPAVAYSPTIVLRQGMRIRHATFGEGVVVTVHGGTGEVKFADGTTRMLAHGR